MLRPDEWAPRGSASQRKTCEISRPECRSCRGSGVTGIGWAIGIGRIGSIVSPILGGWLLARGLPPTQIFLSACLFALIAAIATALLAFRGAGAERLVAQ